MTHMLIFIIVGIVLLSLILRFIFKLSIKIILFVAGLVLIMTIVKNFDVITGFVMDHLSTLFN